MAIVAWDPVKLEEANTVQVDSDAADNRTALLEIEDWAAQHGFVRTDEYTLRQLLRDGKRMFRGTCYRMSPEEIAAASATNSMMERIVLDMPPVRVSF